MDTQEELLFELPGEEVATLEEGPSTGPQPVDDVHIDELLDIVVTKNASDLHICYDAEPIIRVDGALRAAAQRVQRWFDPP